MHTVKNFAFGLLAAAAVASASDVVQLKKDNFNEFVTSNDIVLAECMSISNQDCLVLLPITDMFARQSMPHGADTARPLLQSTKRLRPR